LGKPGRRLPTLAAKDLICVVEADGWQRVKGTDHYAWEHPNKSGKVSIDEKWEHVKVGSWVFRSVREQAGLSRKEFETLYWKHCR
jgi:predicted RNA binding protein YcfA (HicA-like mRNA interferase family)